MTRKRHKPSIRKRSLCYGSRARISKTFISSASRLFKYTCMVLTHCDASQTSQHVRQILLSARDRPEIAYGEDIPPDKNALADWCIARICSWGTTVGMEAFPEAESDGRRTLILGGKVLVLDVEIAVRPHVDIVGVRTSFAVPAGAASGGASNTSGSVSLDGFLAVTLRAFLTEVQKGEEAAASEAARLGKNVLRSLQYLMKLDQLALREGDTGLRWYSDTDSLGVTLEAFTKSEAESVAR